VEPEHEMIAVKTLDEVALGRCMLIVGPQSSVSRQDEERKAESALRLGRCTHCHLGVVVFGTRSVAKTVLTNKIVAHF